MNGFIYMLGNEAMPDLYKIGMTERDDVEERIKELSKSTSVPFSFDLEFAFKINCSNFANIKEFESWLHDSLCDKRVNPKREFFRVSPESVRKMIAPFVEKEEIVIEIEIDKEDEASKEKARKFRPKFRFNMIGVQAGAELTYIRDNTIKAIVVDNQKIQLLDENGQPYGEAGGLSSQVIIQGLGERLSLENCSRSGRYYTDPDTWEYNGKILGDIRRNKESEDNE